MRESEIIDAGEAGYILLGLSEKTNQDKRIHLIGLHDLVLDNPLKNGGNLVSNL
jgi:hypothetical protein